ncbi:putative defense protein 2 [Mytilus californianus]|uniref:putative defense protein 2 n=1 Tax=Mytilus californianus TaxID=6549 RepID=UPI0022465475|nr:putative defense protein 2 [Mytilus californianus]
MKLILTFLFLLSNVSFCLAYSTGAPKSKYVCSRRQPHHGVQPQITSSPFVILVNTTFPGYGDLIEVTVKARENTKFRGFLIQALPENDKFVLKETKPIGAFSSGGKLINCFLDNDTVTHNNNQDKSSIKLLFKMSTSEVYKNFSFSATVVKDFRTFWTDVTSAPISSPDAGPSPSEDWTRTVIKTADSISKGKTEWDRNIDERLKLGYSRMFNSLGQLKTRSIFNNLPFSNRNHGNKESDRNSLYESDKKLDMSSDLLTKELLQGNVNSAVFLAKKFNISFSDRNKQRL